MPSDVEGNEDENSCEEWCGPGMGLFSFFFFFESVSLSGMGFYIVAKSFLIISEKWQETWSQPHLMHYSWTIGPVVRENAFTHTPGRGSVGLKTQHSLVHRYTVQSYPLKPH